MRQPQRHFMELVYDVRHCRLNRQATYTFLLGSRPLFPSAEVNLCSNGSKELQKAAKKELQDHCQQHMVEKPKDSSPVYSSVTHCTRESPEAA